MFWFGRQRWQAEPLIPQFIVARVFRSVVDHVDDILFDRTMPHLMLLGRAVMPLFCFATAAYIYRAGIDKIPNYSPKLLYI